MRLPAMVVCLLLCGLVAPAQPQPNETRSVVQMVRDVASLLTRKYANPAALHQNADKLAKFYSSELRSIRAEVGTLSSEAQDKARGLGLQERLNLAAELWRLRASIDLLSLTDPVVLKDLTGLDVTGFGDVRRRFLKADSALRGG